MKNEPGACKEPFHQEDCDPAVVRRKLTMSTDDIESFLKEVEKEHDKVSKLIEIAEKHFGHQYYNSTYEQLMAADYISPHLMAALHVTDSAIPKAKRAYEKRFPAQARYEVACYIEEEVENFEELKAAFAQNKPQYLHLLTASKYEGCQSKK